MHSPGSGVKRGLQRVRPVTDFDPASNGYTQCSDGRGVPEGCPDVAGRYWFRLGRRGIPHCVWDSVTKTFPRIRYQKGGR
jgi:hypothetical protein